MNVVVIIPVGPGHAQLARRAIRSAGTAWGRSQGPFTGLRIVPVHDDAGTLGRSAARNKGMDANPADWHFLLDADDQMMPLAFSLVDLDSDATFGEVNLDGRRYRKNVWPCTRDTLFDLGAKGTLSMGCFVRGDLGLRFDETMDAGEDFDFYMRLPSFVKRREPLVSIGYSQPSAGGPRGYERIDWLGECAKVIDRYRPATLVEPVKPA